MSCSLFVYSFETCVTVHEECKLFNINAVSKPGNISEI